MIVLASRLYSGGGKSSFSSLCSANHDLYRLDEESLDDSAFVSRRSSYFGREDQ